MLWTPAFAGMTTRKNDPEISKLDSRLRGNDIRKKTLKSKTGYRLSPVRRGGMNALGSSLRWSDIREKILKIFLWVPDQVGDEENK